MPLDAFRRHAWRRQLSSLMHFFFFDVKQEGRTPTGILLKEEVKVLYNRGKKTKTGRIQETKKELIMHFSCTGRRRE
jgi:hypothetical protein